MSVKDGLNNQPVFNTPTLTVNPNQYHIRIQPSKGWSSQKLWELWEYRELLFFLTWRDVKVRYKQTILGAAWAILQPLLTMVVLNIFFGRLANLPSDGVPHTIFYYSALVPWTFFASRMALASNSLVGSARLLKKIYFPRLALPLASVLGGLIDFTLAFIVLLAMMAYYQYLPTLKILWLPYLLLLTISTALGVSLWLSALNVQFRDIRYIVPFITQFWFFATPIAYPSSMIENPIFAAVYALNPMVGVIEGFRWALLGVNAAPVWTMVISSVISFLLLIIGIVYFSKMEKTFADVV